MTTLISFLGKGQDGRGYRDANYHFPDGELASNQKYIGLALADKYQPSKIVLLGTAGSMWDVFLEQISSGLEEEWVELSDSVKEQSVTKDQLQPFEQFLSQRLSAEVHCILIPFAKDTLEQMNILSVLSDSLDDGESIILDVTHGFRHLPMLALVAARF
ncbi:TIGR02221 family CRISPR-associated protein [Psychrobacter lutiphocae]